MRRRTAEAVGDWEEDDLEPNDAIAVDERDRVVARKLLELGQHIFARGTVKDCFAWRDADDHLNRIRFAWLADPIKMVTNMGVGAVEDHLRAKPFDYWLKNIFRGEITSTHFEHEQTLVFAEMLERLAQSIYDVVAPGADDAPVFTVIPDPGWPWPSKGDVYYSAKRDRMVPSKKPDWLVRVPSDKRAEREEQWGIDFCKFLVEPFTGADIGEAIVAEFPGESILVTHVASPRTTDPTPWMPWDSEVAWRVTGESVKRCGGLLFASLAVGPVPATNFGLCVLVARVGLALAGVKPYRRRGRVPVWLYDTDAWTGRLGDFVSEWAVAAFEQMHGHSDYVYNIDNHVWPLGTPTGPMALGGPAEVATIESVKKLNTELKRRFKIWRRDLTPEKVEKVQADVAMTTARYAYLEAKVNGVAPMEAFPVAVCPRQRERVFRAYLDAAGWHGELLVLDVPEEILRSIEDYGWLDKQIGSGPGTMERKEAIRTWAGMQYGWHVADALRKRGPIMRVEP